MARFHSITKNKRRLEAYQKVNGKAIYGDDIRIEGLTYAYGVPAKYTSARIQSIDTEKAEKAEGVVCVVTYKDLPGDKLMGEDIQDQYIFAVDRVITVGDIVALVVADTQEHARAAGCLVHVDYEPLQPVTDVRKAMDSDIVVNPYKEDNICSSCFIHKGKPEDNRGDDEVTVNASYDCRWQEHAYIEPEAIVAYPGRDGRGVVIEGSMQSLYNPAVSIHKSLNIPMNEITVTAKTVGGGVFWRKTGKS